MTATTILGWASFVLILLGGAIVVFGMRDMDRSSGEAAMSGALLTMLGAAPLGLGFLLGIIWVVVK